MKAFSQSPQTKTKTKTPKKKTKTKTPKKKTKKPQLSETFSFFEK